VTSGLPSSLAYSISSDPGNVVDHSDPQDWGMSATLAIADW